MKTVAVSGGFDPVHIGHVRMFEEARGLGDYLTVIVNSDKFLMNKKGFVFMPLEERMEIIKAFGCVDKVVACIDEDQTVCKTLEVVKPTIFANGGDRKLENTPEHDICVRLGIEEAYSIGGGKVQSSSELVAKAKQ